MNCTECRRHLADLAESPLEAEGSSPCQAHLDTCPACRSELAALRAIQQRLQAAARSIPRDSIADAVMARIQALPRPEPKVISMNRFFSGWTFRLAATALAAASLLLVIVLFPGNQVRAGSALARGAQAASRLSSIHIQARLRARPDENFVSMAPEAEFSSVEIWKQFSPEAKWRIEKPGRVAVMDGRNSLLFLKSSKSALRDPASMNAFDTEWLQRLADLGGTLQRELHHAQSQGWKLKLTQERGADGHTQSVVTILATTSLPEDDYLRNRFVELADTRRVYRFNEASGLLEQAQIYLRRNSGEILIFEITAIACNQALDPSLFQLDLPADLAWRQTPPRTGDEACRTLTAEEVTRTFWESFASEDWATVLKLLGGSPLNEDLRQTFGGLQVVHIGPAFTSQAFPGAFVPYEVRLRSGEVRHHNLALRRDESTAAWYVDGGF